MVKKDLSKDEKILTKHPAGKSGRNISRTTYDLMKEEILSLLHDKELTHPELVKGLNKRLTGRFDGNVSWYGETVKLDLEARKLIERTVSQPERYRLKKS
ncbi:MAG TPA: hypothetical protein VJ983_10610 [candidate division Zixibacteria bacterium]|nr:hypothetical protein [candidate division Zixibacteria bacterium]